MMNITADSSAIAGYRQRGVGWCLLLSLMSYWVMYIIEHTLYPYNEIEMVMPVLAFLLTISLSFFRCTD